MLNERYEILGTIGSGATSRVDKARDSLIGRIVALKTFGHGFGSEELQKLFLREAQIVGRLSHRSIIGLYDVGTNPDGAPYLVMEYVPGKTLEKRMAEGPLPLPRIAIWAADLADALARAHRAGIIHGDVKPANVFVTEEGDVKLGDFGIARFATQVSGSGQLMGTPAYLSPEQIHGQPQDHRSDLFSLGVILYQMSTGKRPFDGSSVGAVCAQIISHEPPPPSHHNPDLPKEFDRIVLRCLSKDPVARYPSGDALAASLYPLARSKPLPEPRRLWGRDVRARDLWIAAGLAAVTLATIAVNRRLPSRGFGALSSQNMDTVSAATDPGTVFLPVVSRPDSTIADSVYGRTLLPVAAAPAGGPPGARADSETPATASKTAAHSKTTPARQPRLQTSAAAQPLRATSGDAGSVPPAPVLTPAMQPPLHAAVSPSHGTLEVNIASSVSDEIVAIYADQSLLATVPLTSGTEASPAHLKYPLAAGPHEFRVALYRADRSLQTEKEGLAEIQSGQDNQLGIHVSRHARLLLKHETALEVVWPGSAPASEARKPNAEPRGTAGISAAALQ